MPWRWRGPALLGGVARGGRCVAGQARRNALRASQGSRVGNALLSQGARGRDTPRRRGGQRAPVPAPQFLLRRWRRRAIRAGRVAFRCRFRLRVGEDDRRNARSRARGGAFRFLRGGSCGLALGCVHRASGVRAQRARGLLGARGRASPSGVHRGAAGRRRPMPPSPRASSVPQERGPPTEQPAAHPSCSPYVGARAAIAEAFISPIKRAFQGR